MKWSGGIAPFFSPCPLFLLMFKLNWQAFFQNSCVKETEIHFRWLRPWSVCSLKGRGILKYPQDVSLCSCNWQQRHFSSKQEAASNTPCLTLLLDDKSRVFGQQTTTPPLSEEGANECWLQRCSHSWLQVFINRLVHEKHCSLCQCGLE